MNDKKEKWKIGVFFFLQWKTIIVIISKNNSKMHESVKQYKLTIDKISKSVKKDEWDIKNPLYIWMIRKKSACEK